MNTINANDLKTQGINDHYQQLREYELEIAAQKANADIAAGRFVTESANDYMNRIIKEYDLQADYS
jgi:hypothetical protein